MDWKEVRTADQEKSIWLVLPEDTFRQHLVDLEGKTNAIPIDPHIFDAEDWLATLSRDHERSQVLPLEIEQQVADNYAFLASVTEGAQSVAAVCLEERGQPPGLTLRFATLDSLLNDNIKNGLQAVSRILMGNTSDTTEDKSECLNRMLQLVIDLHFHRLLGRLRSNKWEKPKYLSQSHKKPLWKDFANLSHRVQFLYTKGEKASRHLVEARLDKLSSVYELFESPSEDEVSSLSHVVDASFKFCCADEIKSFTERLQNSHKALKPTPQIASAIKSLRQIEKIAAYRRVCISLLEGSKQYPKLFRDIRMEYLTPYKSVPTSIGYEGWARTCHVHAEIQLAVHYDLNPNYTPRCIGTSKWLCYLCYRFLQAHGVFFPAKTHGRLYDQWTVPDLMEFGEDIVRRYRDILKAVDEVVVDHSENEPELWRLMPMTSVDCGPFIQN